MAIKKKCATCGAKITNVQVMYDEKEKKTVRVCGSIACRRPYLITPQKPKGE